MSRGRTVLFAAKVLAAVASAALTVGLALTSAKTWQPADRTVLGLAATAATLALVTSTSQAWTDHRGRRQRQLHEHVATHLRAAFWNVHDATHEQIDPKDLGVAVYLLAWDRPRLRGLRPYWRPRRLQRLHRDRPRHHNESTGLVWRPGKGVIGACVAHAGIAHCDLSAAWGPHLQATEAQWAALDPRVTQGLAYREFRSLVDGGKRLGVVVASPILRDGRAVGCVAVDGPPGAAAYELLRAQRVKDSLADTAAAVGMLV